MICVNCEKDIQDNIEQCPFCGCHYPEQIKKTQTQQNQSDFIRSNINKEKERIQELIDAITFKGTITEKERQIIIETAEKGGLDLDTTNIMINTALTKIQEENKIITDSNTPISKNQIEPKEQDKGTIHDPSTSICHDGTTPYGNIDTNITHVTSEKYTIFCRKCGTSLAQGAHFCKRCGAKIN